MTTTSHTRSAFAPLKGGLLVGALLAATPALALSPDTFDGSGKVETELVVPDTGIAPGSDTMITLRMSHDEGWHTYWPGRNDTGMGTTIAFDDEEGLAFGEPIWPTPERYLAPGDILDHVYEHEIEIHIPVRVDPSLEPGSFATISARIDFLVCEQICLPGTHQAGAMVRVSEDADAPEMPVTHEPLDPDLASWDSSAVTIRVPGADRYVFFPLKSCAPIADLIRDGAQSGPDFTIELEADDDRPRLSGRLLVVHEDGHESHFDLDLRPN